MDSRRAESFSDGVFAVAITILVFDLLPIGAPTLQAGHLIDGRTLRGDLVRAWPHYAAYVVSFLTIGIMWLNHHTLLSQVKRVSRTLLVLNILLLLGVVAVPFPTALVAEYLSRGGKGSAVVATVTYGLVMIAISIAFSAMWLYVASHREQLMTHSGLRQPRVSALRFSAGLGGYVAGTVLAAYYPGVAVAIFGLIAVYYLFEHLPDPSDDTAESVVAPDAGAPR